MSFAQHTPRWLPPLDPYKGSGRTLTINGVPALLVKRVLAESDRFCPVTLAQADVFARLFAAAPDLLAALERIANMGPDSEPENDYDDMEGAEYYGVSIALWEAAEIARTAIAKAKEGAT